LKFESELAESVFKSKYLLEGETTADEAVERIVKAVAKVFPEIEEEAREYINKQWFIPAGGIWRASGNPNKNVSHINCTTLTPPDDNLEGIFDSLYKWAKYAAFGQGEGIDISNLRPKGSKVHNSSRTSTGAVSFMSLYDAVLKVIAQQGRRGASLISIRDSHPDIEDFISIKDKPESDKSRIDTANISIQATNAFMSAVKNNEDWMLYYENKYERIERKVKAKELFDKICHMAWKRGDPGLQFIDTAKYNSNSDALDIKICSTNACCFTGDTLITTKQGLFPIKDLVGKEVEIFDSKNWININTFKSYGEDEIYRVTLNNGIYFDVTGNHRFFLENGKEKRTHELQVGDKLEESNTIIPTVGKDEEGAYFKGFMLGDGSVDNEDTPRPLLYLYSPKYMCKQKLEESLKEIPINSSTTNTKAQIDWVESPSNKERIVMTGVTCRDRSNLYKWGGEYKFNLPDEVFGWSKKSKLELLAGLFDSDGTALNNSKGFGYQLCSINKNFLISIVRLLSSVGVYSRIASGSKEKIKNIKGFDYQCKEVWRITIPQKYAIEFGKIAPFARLINFNDKQIKHFKKFRYNKVVSVESLNKKEEVFCCTVPTTGKFLINSGIITGNSEQWLDPENVCNLSHINLGKFYEYGEEGYFKLIKFGIKFLNAIRINEYNENRSPTEVQHNKLKLAPRVGLGFTGFADYLLDKKIPYGSQESINEMNYIGTNLAKYSLISSNELAKKYGSFEAYNKEKFKNSGYIKRLLDNGVITDDILDYQFNVALTTIAPVGTGAIIANDGGSGIEPLFSRYMVRRERSTTKDWKEWFTFNPYVERYLLNNGIEVTKENADKLTEPWWVMSFDVNPLNKIKLVAEAQKWIDSSISVTFNLPEDATIEDVEKVYMAAWEHELKGVTVYREGSLGGVLITEKSYNKQLKEAKKEAGRDATYERRPDILNCDIYEAKYKENKFIVLIGLKNENPYEVFITPNDDNAIDVEKFKKGKIVKVKSGHYDLIVENGITKTMINNIGKTFDSMYGTLSRMISMSLRHNVPLQFIVDQLNKDSGFIAFEKVLSRILKKYIKDNTSARKKCPHCGAELIYQDGCVSCSNKECSFSKCD
jgi:ribonucleoside-diphosphate reductase alpha chain